MGGKLLIMAVIPHYSVIRDPHAPLSQGQFERSKVLYAGADPKQWSRDEDTGASTTKWGQILNAGFLPVIGDRQYSGNRKLVNAA